jgi:hypothetical protein
LTISEPKTSRSRRQLRLSRAAVGALRKHRAVQNEERLRLGSVWEGSGLPERDWQTDRGRQPSAPLILATAEARRRTEDPLP